MFGRDATRNSVSQGTNPQVWWDVQTGRNIKWQTAIGIHAWAQPVVANGLVWIGTDNQLPRDPDVTGPAGILMCFRESDGTFLYQHVSPARQGPGYWQAHTGTAGSPLIEGDRLWFVSTRSEVICLDIGNYIEFGELPGRLVCLDPTREGDISLELNERPDRGRPNPNSGVIWHFDEMGRTMSTVAIKDGLVIAPDHAGNVHCLDADTGQLYWTHDLRSLTMSSPLIVEDRIYMADEDGDVCILELSRVKRVIAEHLMNE